MIPWYVGYLHVIILQIEYLRSLTVRSCHTTDYSNELPNLIKVGQVALLLSLHTADCERAFSGQNLIVTKLRNRLVPDISDKLLIVRIHDKGLKEHEFSKTCNLAPTEEMVP